MPWSARLSASLPPLVKTISSAAQPSSAATSPRPASSNAFAGRPAQCPLDGLPKPSPSSAAAMASRTSGATGVVALKSR